MGYLILVSSASTGGGAFFSSWCTFFPRKRDKDCFQQSLLREICTSLVMKVCQIHQTKHQVHQTNTKYANKHQICQKNTPNTPKKHKLCKKTPTMPKKNTKYAKKHQLCQKTPNTQKTPNMQK